MLVPFAAATGTGIVAADFPVFTNVGSIGLLALPVEMLELQRAQLISLGSPLFSFSHGVPSSSPPGMALFFIHTLGTI